MARVTLTDQILALTNDGFDVTIAPLMVPKDGIYLRLQRYRDDSLQIETKTGFLAGRQLVAAEQIEMLLVDSLQRMAEEFLDSTKSVNRAIEIKETT